MGSILEVPGNILGAILELIGGGLTSLTENLTTLGLTVFALALGIFAIVHLARRRRTLDHQRMAAMIKGLHYAGLPPEVFTKRKADSRDHLMSGLRWLLGALGLSAALYSYGSLEPGPDADYAIRGALVGIVPGALGIARLLCAWICARGEKQSLLSSRLAYRATARRS